MLLTINLGTFISTSGNGMELDSDAQRFAKTGNLRLLKKVALTGSTAVNDMRIKIVKKGVARGTPYEKVLAYLKNHQITHDIKQEDLKPVYEFIERGEEIAIYADSDAQAGCKVHLLLRTIPTRRRGTR